MFVYQRVAGTVHDYWLQSSSIHPQLAKLCPSPNSVKSVYRSLCFFLPVVSPKFCAHIKSPNILVSSCHKVTKNDGGKLVGKSPIYSTRVKILKDAFPVKTSINRGFSVVTFDFQRVVLDINRGLPRWHLGIEWPERDVQRQSFAIGWNYTSWHLGRGKESYTVSCFCWEW